MKIYTKSGDAGETGLYGGGRVSKTDPRIQAVGELDELNSVLGLCRLHAAGGEVDASLARIQNLLFDLGAEVASFENGRFPYQAIADAHVEGLEREIDAMSAELAPMREFILPGGTALAAHLHHARTVCRRAERRMVELDSQAELRPESLRFLNRLSDWLFVAARAANAREGRPDVPWSKVTT